MAESLQEQLRKAGLVTREQARKAQVDRRRKAKQRRGGKDAGEQDAARRRLREAQAAKAAHDRELERARAREAERRAVVAQIRQMIEAHRLSRGDAEIPYQFVDAGRIARIWVSRSMQIRLAQGQAAIVRLGDEYEVVPAEVAERIQRRDPGGIVVWNISDSDDDDVEGGYAQYRVPDDLMW